MRGGSDAAVSDILGTLLMAAGVVLAGGVLTAVVAQQLSAPAPPSAVLALAPVAPGDADARLVLRHGEPLALDELSLAVSRNASAAVVVPRSSWTTPHPEALRPGDTLSFALSPPVGADETVRVRVVHAATNALLAEHTARAAASSATVFAAPTLTASVTPGVIVADATTAALLAVRVSHPEGTLAVASLVADLSQLTNASRSANATVSLVDTGRDGDLVGGDGVYSTLVRAAINTTPGIYAIPVRATDVAGRVSASTSTQLAIASNLTQFVGNVTSAIGNATSAIGNFSNFTGNFSGNCYGCVITGGANSYEGTRLIAPTSQNVTAFRLLNWTWDRQNPGRLDNDAGVVRIISSSYAWSAYFNFEAMGTQNVPVITRLMMYDANRTTVYVPASNGSVGLAGLDLDMLDPTTSGFVCSEGCATRATYQNASIQGRPGFVVAWLRDETNNFQTDELGIFAMDVMLT